MTDDRGVERGTEKPDGEGRTVHHHHHHHTKTVRRHTVRGSILRVVLVGALIFWILGAYYPDGDGDGIPFVPGISCDTSSATATAAVYAEPVGIGGWLAEKSVSGLGKVAAWTVGDRLKALTEGPPTVDNVVATWDGIIGTATDLTAAFLSGARGTSSEPDPKPKPRPRLVNPFIPMSDPCGPCPSAVTPVGMSAGIATTARAALAAGWTGDDAVTAVAIAGAESGYRPTAANTSSTARGLWQIMLSYHRHRFRGADWSNPAANARVAHALWSESGWRPWVTYTSGAYRKHLPEARAAVTAAQGGIRTVAATKPANGLQPVALAAQQVVRNRFGFRGTIGGYSHRNIAGTNTLSKHATGMALDIMTSDRKVGDRIAAYFAGPGYQTSRVENVIWQRRIYNESGGWHPYSGVSPHTDHVHVDFTGDGAAAPVATCGKARNVAADPTSAGFNAATFNVLGSSHTSGDGPTRAAAASTLLRRSHVDVAGLQELQADQAAVFDAAGWGRFSNPADTDNSVVWNPARFTLASGTLIPGTYFQGRIRLMPAIVLKDRRNGQAVTVVNVHNPADTARYPNQGHWRDDATRSELAYVRAVAGPVVLTGDFNDRAWPAKARQGRVTVAGPDKGIDYVNGRRVTFTAHKRIDAGTISDHDLIRVRVTPQVSL